MAEALASRWAAYPDVFIDGRNAEKANALADELGHETRWDPEAEAMGTSGIIVLATRHEVVFKAMDAAGGSTAFAGKTLIDINNPVPGALDGGFLNAGDDGRSLVEKIAEYAPAAHMVKAFNTCQASV